MFVNEVQEERPFPKVLTKHESKYVFIPDKVTVSEWEYPKPLSEVYILSYPFSNPTTAQTPINPIREQPLPYNPPTPP